MTSLGLWLQPLALHGVLVLRGWEPHLVDVQQQDSEAGLLTGDWTVRGGGGSAVQADTEMMKPDAAVAGRVTRCCCSALPRGSLEGTRVPPAAWLPSLCEPGGDSAQWLDAGAVAGPEPAGRPCWGLKTGAPGSDVACVVTLDGASHVSYLREGEAT